MSGDILSELKVYKKYRRQVSSSFFIDEKMSHGRDRKSMWLLSSRTGTPTQAPELTTLKYYAILPLTEIQGRINM